MYRPHRIFIHVFHFQQTMDMNVLTFKGKIAILRKIQTETGTKLKAILFRTQFVPRNYCRDFLPDSLRSPH